MMMTTVTLRCDRIETFLHGYLNKASLKPHYRFNTVLQKIVRVFANAKVPFIHSLVADCVSYYDRKVSKHSNVSWALPTIAVSFLPSKTREHALPPHTLS